MQLSGSGAATFVLSPFGTGTTVSLARIPVPRVIYRARRAPGRAWWSVYGPLRSRLGLTRGVRRSWPRGSDALGSDHLP
jgi:hypothetical protein